MHASPGLKLFVAGVLTFGAGAAAGIAGPAAAATAPAPVGGDARVSSGSPRAPFSQNKQNEPAVTHDPLHPNVLVAGANDNIDMEACNAGADNTCPFTKGVGVSGVYFSNNTGRTWTQPEYTGNTARGCLGVVGGADPGCTPTSGPIGTLPNYAEHGLVSDGDPALAFGPVYRNGRFSWDNGSRLYYVNLASAMPGAAPFKGAEAIAVSHTDDVPAAMAGHNGAWSAPVIASKQNAALFSDKEQVWADNAATSKYFGNTYVCYAGFRSNGSGFGNQPLFVLTSRDGGESWAQQQVTAAANNPNGKQGYGRSGCTVRTDSRGTVYVFDYQFANGTPGAGSIQLITSSNGGATWSRPRTVTTAYDTCNYLENSIGRCVEDGVAGARDDLSPSPSVDIANGAPSGTDATDEIVLTWVDGRAGLNHEHVVLTSSSDGAGTWATPRNVETAGDRGYYSAPAISPDGKNVWLVYNAFTTSFKGSAVGPDNDRELVGVVKHAFVTGGDVGAFTPVHRGEPGDARASSQNNLAAEFLGDYVYATADRDYGAAVWNDMRNGVECPAIDSYRQQLHDAATPTSQTADAEEPRGMEDEQQHGGKSSDAAAAAPVAPNVQRDCDPGFGDSDIYGGAYPNPNPVPAP